MTEADRMKRAGNYVLGLMDDSERERAERDLEIDPSFRDAVVEIAARMHMFDHATAPDKTPEDGWKGLKDHIAGMPQMRAAAPPESPVEPEPPVTFGRRRSDARRETIMPAAAPKITPIALAFGSGPAGDGDSRRPDRGFRAGLFCRRFVRGRTAARRCRRTLNGLDSAEPDAKRKTAGFGPAVFVRIG